MGTPLPYLLYEIRLELHITRSSPSGKCILRTVIFLFTDIYKSQVTAMNYDYTRAEKIQRKTFELMIIITPIR